MQIKVNKSIFLGIAGALSIFGLSYYVVFPGGQAHGGVVLNTDDERVISLGQQVYVQNCAACHGAQLEGQPSWYHRDANGYMPAPPHDETGHTWHHSDDYLFSMTKYGIEKVIGKKYPNNMPIYKDHLTDEQIIAVLSYIKSTWPRHIRDQHNNINARANLHRRSG